MSEPLHLVLVGGGHAMLPSLAHAREWTDAGVKVTLVDPQRWLYYSGMVPEHLGGVYAVDDIRVDLRKMAREAGATHVADRATALDPEARMVTTAEGDTIPYDVLAIDVGGVNPALPDAAVGTKPIYRVRALRPHLKQVLDAPTETLGLTIVGGGAAGVEVALNITGRFAGAGRAADLSLTIVEQSGKILPGFPEGMRAYAARLLRERGATIRTATTVDEVHGSDEGRAQVDMRTDSGEHDTIHPDAVLWSTGAVAPPLLRKSGLSTDERGFLHVTRRLRTPTHPRIFAAGDCGTIPELDLDKVGVHAVKQGPDLRANLDTTVRRLAGDGSAPAASDLTVFRPYPVAPLLVSTGTRRAIWTAGPLWTARTWSLRLKHWVDRRWIQRYAPERWGRVGWRSLVGAEAASDPDGTE
ncbi:selenide,water dikinase [Salinibacter ruber]|uniref:NAD(P)/FAD-dependent oxidoreductase n=1 Tax=Salinibacter ruber TaxID=146919 RepID=UPI002169F9EE|nr:FAD-dependent oxidoreductase [Salinibacter ruber]MCS3666238.1 selenide,water dikinase [Salinibacter ruber]